MDLRRELTRKIGKKQAEITEWIREKNRYNTLIREGRAYIEALTETLKLLPKENATNTELTLRPGSEVAKSRLAILAAGRPLHVDELLKALEKPVTHNNKASLSGSLSVYVRKDEIFTRPAPNTFGLIELEQKIVQEPLFQEEPPPNFGSMDGQSEMTEESLEEEE